MAALTLDHPRRDAQADGRRRSRQAEPKAGSPRACLLCHNGPHYPQAWPELTGTATGFAPREAVEVAAAMWPTPDDLPPVSQSAQVITLTVAPGLLTFRVTDPRSSDSAAVRRAEQDARRRMQAIEDGVDRLWSEDPDDLEGELLTQDLLNGPDDDEPDHAGRGVVTEFSRASRRRLGRKVASLDWGSAIRPGERMCMITLTWPRDWRGCVPTPSDAYKQLRALSKRFERATGTPLRCVWKREFQRRGAPHYHLLAVVPPTIGDRQFRDWLSHTWYEVVASGDERHLAAGTGVDWSEGLRCSDARRAAAYLVGYTVGSKGHQHHAPDDWTNDGGSVGRWWGVFGLEEATAEVRVSERQLIEAKRLLRRLLRSQGRTRRVRVRRVDRRTGEVRYRTVRRRYRLPSLATGARLGCTLLVNDGPSVGVRLSRSFSKQPEWPPGKNRPLP